MTSDVDFEMEEMREIIDDFLVEADELIEALDNNFVKLETSPGDLDLLNEIFRAVHTIKGTSSFLGFEQVTTLAHKMEDILNKLRKSELTVTPQIMDVLLEGLDLLKLLLDTVRDGTNETHDLKDILARLDIALGSESESDGESEELASEELPEVTPEVLASDDADEVPIAEEATDPTATAKSAMQKKRTEQTIRVDVDRLDNLMNMMGELVLGRNSLMQGLSTLNTEHEGDFQLDQVNQATKSINFITTELQMAVMKMRMLPVGKVFGRFPRQVRDLSREMDKEINLHISGETTELDKSVIEEIGDPLMHIIRNSCDHGLETAEDRVLASKPKAGNIWLQAAQEGSNIVISVRDDGRGFDIDAIKAKAISKGLATPEEIERMSDKEIYSFVFQAGFSTAKVITDVSGRGVGMDVVRTNIEKINGLIELNCVPGQGSTITIKLPLTLAIIQGLLVECDDEVFILPLSSVHETIKLEDSSVFYVNQRPVFRLREEIIPIINLADILSSDPKGFILTEKPYIVVVGLAEKKLGLMIDRFLGQEEVVIKSLGSYLGTTEGVAGATILGDGRIRLIVDLIGMFKLAKSLAG